jgi:predicted regulator of Ras-like GTPase activity (Roadblock/LC7/MglB family)
MKITIQVGHTVDGALAMLLDGGPFSNVVLASREAHFLAAMLAAAVHVAELDADPLAELRPEDLTVLNAILGRSAPPASEGGAA